MKCMSCEADIPSEWTSCIANNLCPKCGASIMDMATKDMFDELNNVMAKLKLAPEGVMDLVLSSFNLREIGAAELAQEIESHDSIPAGLKTAHNPVQEWLARSNAPHLAKRTDKIRDILKKVQDKEGDVLEIDYNDVEIEDEGIPSPMMTYKDALANNVIVAGGGDPPTPEETAQLEEAFGNDVGEVVDPSLHPALQQDRVKRLMQSRGVAQGGGQGSFRRTS